MPRSDRVRFFKGDITAVAVDVIVNAANPSLAGGGGVDGAIHAAAGPDLKRAAIAFAPCEPGQAVITPGFDLQAKFVIHTVGPIWRGGDSDEAATLESAYRESFVLALEHDLKTICCPAISCGAYGYPIREAVKVGWDTARRFVADFDDISFACFDGRVLHEFQRLEASS